MRGKDVDLGHLEKEAAKWAREANLPDTGGKQYHDYVHVLFHEFMGGPDKIAERAGVKGKSPTVAEEFLVTTLQEDVMTRHRTGKPISRAKIIENLSILYAMFRGHGQIPAGELEFYKDFGRFADLYEGIKKEPGFKQLTEAAAAIPTVV